MSPAVRELNDNLTFTLMMCLSFAIKNLHRLASLSQLQKAFGMCSTGNKALCWSIFMKQPLKNPR